MAPALAQRFRTDRAFERLYRRHVADVYRYSLAVLRNPADAEDVTQTTFLNAYRAFKRGERPDAANNWLIKIAHNVCRQRFRTSARRPQEVALDGDVTGPIAEEQEGPSAQDIRRGLGQLAFNQRAALVARELEGRSYAEIGEILGLSVAAVETLIFRARRALREQLEGSLTCHEAELAISRQLDGWLPRGDKGALRAHLRECGECATFARRLRAQRSALKALAAVPIPGSLASFFGGTSVGSGVVALKAGAIAATFVAAGAATSVGVKHAPWQDGHRHAAAASQLRRPRRSRRRRPAARAVPAAAPLSTNRHEPRSHGSWCARSRRGPLASREPRRSSRPRRPRIPARTATRRSRNRTAARPTTRAGTTTALRPSESSTTRTMGIRAAASRPSRTRAAAVRAGAAAIRPARTAAAATSTGAATGRGSRISVFRRLPSMFPTRSRRRARARRVGRKFPCGPASLVAGRALVPTQDHAARGSWVWSPGSRKAPPAACSFG